jgi:HCOMODA/2-hydroxy-3-carboxy-muconic semialdehyde decarboxylase
MARALGQNGLSGPFGHCSVRLDAERFLVCAPRPMGLIGIGEAGTPVEVVGDLPDGVLGEVRLHQQIYRRRPWVGAICRFISPQITALAAMGRTPAARHGFGSYFAGGVPMWSHAALIRNDAAAEKAADLMGDRPALFLSVNGAVTAAETPERAVALAYFLEDAARVELAAMATGQDTCGPLLPNDVAHERATWNGRIAERVWEYLLRNDPEPPSR